MLELQHISYAVAAPEAGAHEILGEGRNIMTPQAIAYLEEGAFLKMDTSRIRGVDSTKRDTKIVCGKGAEAVVTERLQTPGLTAVEAEGRTLKGFLA